MSVLALGTLLRQLVKGVIVATRAVVRETEDWVASVVTSGGGWLVSFRFKTPASGWLFQLDSKNAECPQYPTYRAGGSSPLSTSQAGALSPRQIVTA